MNDFGVIGLAVMGKNISLNLLDNGFKLSLYNRDVEGENKMVASFVDDFKSQYEFNAFTQLNEFFQSLQRPRKVLCMIKAGRPMDDLIQNCLKYLSPGDILIDGGNSHYEDTIRRENELSEHGIHFFGCGISGGELGARYGAAIMPGGEKAIYNEIAPYLESIAAKDKSGLPCCNYIGPGGAGHFVKMVHNGIEYAEMQFLAEMYQVLNTQFEYHEIAELLDSWKDFGLDSYLLGITVDILKHREGNEYLLDKILDKAANKGTGAWSSIASFKFGSVNNIMASAVFERYISSYKELRAKLSVRPIDKPHNSWDTEKLMNAYAAVRILNHHQGFELIRLASLQNHWDINLSDLARVWTNGCIIRSDFMLKCQEYFKSADSLLGIKSIISKISEREQSLTETISQAMEMRIPLPAMSSALNYWLSITTGRLPANLIQAQRDYFGAHQYQRVDDDSGRYYHTNWNV